MKTLRIPEKGVEIKFADCLEELTPEDWLFYNRLIIDLESGQLSEMEFRLALIYQLLGLKFGKSQSPEKNDNIAYLCQQLSGFINRDGDSLHVNTETVKCLLPQIEYEGKVYPGPGDLLSEMTFGTFLECYRVYANYLKSQQADALPYFCKLMYGLPAKAELPAQYARASYYFFISCINHLTSAPIVMHGQELPVHQIFQGGSAEGSPELPFDPVLFDIGENGVFGSIDKLKKQNLLEVLRYLYRKHLQAQKEKRKNAQRKQSQ